MVWKPTNLFLANLVSSLTANIVSGNYSGPLNGAYLGLVQQPSPLFTRDTLLSDITEATYAGYARRLIVWGPPFEDQAAEQVLEGVSLHYAPTSLDIANTITGCFVASALTGGALWLGAMFDGETVGLVGPNSGLTLVPRYGQSFLGPYAGPVLVD